MSHQDTLNDDWSIAVHFALALVGVQAVRDSDAEVENRVLELKAATARQDIITLRKAAAIGSPLALLAAKRSRSNRPTDHAAATRAKKPGHQPPGSFSARKIFSAA